MQKHDRFPFGKRDENAGTMEPFTWWFRSPSSDFGKAGKGIRRERKDWCYRKLVKTNQD